MRNALVLAGLYVVAAFLYTLTRMYGGFGAHFLFSAFVVFVAYETFALFSTRRAFVIVRHIDRVRIRAGEDVVVRLRLSIADRGWMPIQWLKVEDDLPQKLAVRLTEPQLLIYPWRRREIDVTYALKGIPRGAYRMRHVYVTGGDVFGLIALRTRVDAPGELIVYPATHRIVHWSSMQKARLGNRVAQSRSSDDASRVIGIRDYVPGDRISRIHWPATARTGALRSKEFEHYVQNEVMVFLDASRHAYGQDVASFELALSTIGSILEYLHERSIAFGLTGFAHTVWEYPMRGGDLSLMKTLEYLSVVEPDGVQSPYELPGQWMSLPRQTTVVIVTHTVTEHWLPLSVIARERQLRVVVFAVRTTEATLTAEEEAAASGLRAQGWRIRIVCSLTDLDALIMGGTGYANRA